MRIIGVILNKLSTESRAMYCAEIGYELDIPPTHVRSALRVLEKAGLVTAQWGMAEHVRNSKRPTAVQYFKPTQKGTMLYRKIQELSRMNLT